MKAEEYFSPLMQMMQEKGNPNEALAMKKYLRNQYDFYGLKQNPRREICKKFIENLKDSKEFFIKKAIGWILREYSKTNSGAVIDFVKDAEISNFSKTEALKWLKRRGEL